VTTLESTSERLTDALRRLAVVAADLFEELLAEGAELPFDLEPTPGDGPLPMYQYQPLTGQFITRHMVELRRLEAFIEVRELAGDQGVDRLRANVGLPLSTYFSGPKVRWLLDNVDGARKRAENGELAFGTTDSWVLWNLTGGKDGGIHVTDVTNASRTMLMNLETLDWHEESLDLMGIPRSMLPEIKSSSEVYGEAKGSAIGGRPISGILGDQQAALFGQTCFDTGDAKNTYGTGSFLLVNTGEDVVRTDDLLTTVGYKLGDGKVTYALEGSIAVTGALIQWLRDRLEIIDDAAESHEPCPRGAVSWLDKRFSQRVYSCAPSRGFLWSLYIQ